MDNKEVIERYKKQLNAKLIAVDFDDTITFFKPYPEKGPLNPAAKKYLTKLHEAGYELVLWSARMTMSYEEAYNRCVEEFGMPFIKRDSKEYVHGTTGKLIARFYIDDKSIPGKLNWRKIYKFIIKNIK